MALTVLIEVHVEVLLGSELVGDLAGLEVDKASLVAASGVLVVHYVKSRFYWAKDSDMFNFYRTALISYRNCG